MVHLSASLRGVCDIDMHYNLQNGDELQLVLKISSLESDNKLKDSQITTYKQEIESLKQEISKLQSKNVAQAESINNLQVLSVFGILLVSTV